MRCVINPDAAPELLKDFEQVHLKEGAKHVEIDKPTNGSGKLRTHLCFRGDTLVETERGVVALCDLPRTGLVRGQHGTFVHFVDAGLTIRDAPMIEIEVVGAAPVRCTPWHEMLTIEHGWLRADRTLGLTIRSWRAKYEDGERERGRVQRVTRVANADAFCLRVPIEGCFALASGLIVSNSDALGYYLAAAFPVRVNSGSRDADY